MAAQADRHPRESGDPGAGDTAFVALDSRFRGNDA